MVGRCVTDVLSDAGVAVTREPHDGRVPHELRRPRTLEPLQAIGPNDERKIREPVERALAMPRW